MAARADEITRMGPAKGAQAIHHYSAEANLLTAEIEEPLKEHVRPQEQVKLSVDGSYQFKHAGRFRLEGILSYESGYTQVAGHPSSKVDGFTTLATSVVEGLNVLDVVTADRVVAQISTVHPVFGDGHVPAVTFLGTRFENLRIAGHKVEVEPNLEIFGQRDVNDESYFDSAAVTGQIAEQYRELSKDGLPAWTREFYPKDRAVVQDISQGRRQMHCSVVNSVKNTPGTPFGHVIDLPHFGKIFLGEVKLVHERSKNPKEESDKYRFHLTMIRMKMGCLASGNSGVSSLDTNGQGSGGGTRG
jgi:hypothetical protein